MLLTFSISLDQVSQGYSKRFIWFQILLYDIIYKLGVSDTGLLCPRSVIAFGNTRPPDVEKSILCIIPIMSFSVLNTDTEVWPPQPSRNVKVFWCDWRMRSIIYNAYNIVNYNNNNIIIYRSTEKGAITSLRFSFIFVVWLFYEQIIN